jgi:hypothetical protein
MDLVPLPKVDLVDLEEILVLLELSYQHPTTDVPLVGDLQVLLDLELLLQMMGLEFQLLVMDALVEMYIIPQSHNQ